MGILKVPWTKLSYAITLAASQIMRSSGSAKAVPYRMQTLAHGPLSPPSALLLHHTSPSGPSPPAPCTPHGGALDPPCSAASQHSCAIPMCPMPHHAPPRPPMPLLAPWSALLTTGPGLPLRGPGLPGVPLCGSAPPGPYRAAQEGLPGQCTQAPRTPRHMNATHTPRIACPRKGPALVSCVGVLRWCLMLVSYVGVLCWCPVGMAYWYTMPVCHSSVPLGDPSCM